VRFFGFVFAAMIGHPLRSALSALGVAIGVASVMLLSSLGEGTREHIVNEFTQFGTNLIAINPGKVETLGMPGVLGGTTHKLDLDDAAALQQLRGVKGLVPIAMGQARVESSSRSRAVYVYGVNHEAPAMWSFEIGQGGFLPELDLKRKASQTVLGPKLAREIFGKSSPLGERVRIGGESFLVIGVMAPKGQMLGFDLDDCAYIPVANAMDIFNTDELMEIDLQATSAQAVSHVVEGIRTLLTARHRGEEDFTITTQQEMLSTFGRIMSFLTIAVSGIAGISLFVGAIGILTIMWISVHERTGEIGLLRSMGVSARGVAGIFLLEAVLIALCGGLAGVLGGTLIGWLLTLAVPNLPFSAKPETLVAAVAVSISVGILSGYLPARRAALLDPIESLRAE
jgi:putative ABC transport system permease protein